MKQMKPAQEHGYKNYMKEETSEQKITTEYETLQLHTIPAEHESTCKFMKQDKKYMKADAEHQIMKQMKPAQKHGYKNYMKEETSEQKITTIHEANEAC